MVSLMGGIVLLSLFDYFCNKVHIFLRIFNATHIQYNVPDFKIINFLLMCRF